MNPDRILSETFIQTADHRRKCASTNDVAIERILSGDLALPFLVSAGKQTGGRGRGNNRWWSSEGALTFSVAVDDATCGFRVGLDSRIAIATGLAIAETLSQAVGADGVALKWPNDVWIEQKKTCGILVEVTGIRRDAAVIGIGLNVNNSVAEAPEDIRSSATSLRDATGKEHDREAILVALLQHLEQQLRLLASPGDDLPERWNAYCGLSGRVVTIHDGEREITGLCHGIDVAGTLLLQNETTLHRVVAGSVVSVGD